MYGDKKDNGKPLAEPCPYTEGELRVAWDLGHIQGARAGSLLTRMEEERLPEEERAKAIRRELEMDRRVRRVAS
jgi:hypothetical protein